MYAKRTIVTITRRVVSGSIFICIVVGYAASTHVWGATFYADASRPDDTGMGTNWISAKKYIQSAVNLAANGDTVWVTNGIYNFGSTITPGGAILNRVVITNDITVESINGASNTVISGEGPLGTAAVRCVFIKRGKLVGFTLTNGHTHASGSEVDKDGGGIYMHYSGAPVVPMVVDCLISGNSAAGSGGGVKVDGGGIIRGSSIIGNTANHGGGAFGVGGIYEGCEFQENAATGFGGGGYSGFYSDCRIVSNDATVAGGGLYGSLAHDCELIGNISDFGGGATDSRLYRCILSGNHAHTGGGGRSCDMDNCLIVSNTATTGGGVYGELFYGSLSNCTVTGNRAISAGGVFNSRVVNSIVYDNIASNNPNHSGSIFNSSCTTPNPDGMENITTHPLFANPANNDYQLAMGSPCINAGNNAYVTSTLDINQSPRIIGGTVDLGCYEYAYTTAGIHYTWLQKYSLPIDGTADMHDPDMDSLTTLEEYISDTVPTNASSVFVVHTIFDNGDVLRWSSSSGRIYSVEYAYDPSAGSFSPLMENLPATPPENTFTNTQISPPFLQYRVSVQIDHD